MPDVCPYLEYRRLTRGAGASGGDDDIDVNEDEPRAYCTAAETFVQPMRADICNGRYGLDHETDCEIYRDHEGRSEGVPGEGAAGVEDEGPGTVEDEDANAGGD